MVEIREVLEIAKDGAPTGRYRMTWRSDEIRGSLRSDCPCAGPRGYSACPGHATPQEALAVWKAKSNHWSVRIEREEEAAAKRRVRLAELTMELPTCELRQLLCEELRIPGVDGE